MTISRICTTAPLRGRNTKVCLWCEIPDVITPVKYHVDRLRGYWFLRVWKSWCSIDKARRPYNSSALPCRLWCQLPSRWSRISALYLIRSFYYSRSENAVLLVHDCRRYGPLLISDCRGYMHVTVYSTQTDNGNFIGISRFFHAALNARRSSREKGVCLSSSPSNACIVIKRKKNQPRCLDRTKDHLA